MRSAVMASCTALVCLAFAAPPVYPDGASAEMLSWSCNGCHGGDGISQGSSIPTIAGMNAEFMAKAMEQFKEGSRSATIMNRIARGYKGYELRKIARYFSRRPWVRVHTPLDPALIDRGRELHERHCAECHEDSGRYQDRDMPRLAGQRPDYLLLQLQGYVNKLPKMPQPSDMREQLAKIDTSDLAALGAFYSSVD